MCDQLREAAQRDAKAEEWALLHRTDDPFAKAAPAAAVEQAGGAVVPPAVDAFLTGRIMPLATKETDHYNRNGPLGDAICEAVHWHSTPVP